MPTRTAGRALTGAARSLAYHLVIEPVRQGGPLPGRWPRPVRITMTVALVAYAVLMVSVLFSGLTEPPSGDYGAMAVPGRILVGLGVSFVLFSLLAAAWHLPWPLAVLIGLAVAATLVATAATTFRIALLTGEDAAPVVWLALAATLVLQWIALLVVCLVRRRKPVTGPWLIALGALVGTSYLLPVLGSTVADPEHSSMSTIATLLPLVILTLAAAPLAIASGTAFAEITVRAVTWTLMSARPLVSIRFWQVLVVLLGALHTWRAVQWRPSPQWQDTVGLPLIVGTLAVTFGCVAWARRRGPRGAPRPTTVAEHLPRFAYLIAPFLIWPLLWPGGGSVKVQMAVGIGIGRLVALVLTARAIGRGDTVTAALGPPMACGLAVLAVNFAFGVVLQSDLVTGMVLAALLVGWLVVRGVRRRLRPADWIVVSIGLTLVFVYPWRAVFAEPIGAALGFSSVALVFFGLIWRALTDGGYTRVDGRMFPIGARAFLFAAHSLTAAVAVVMTAYSNWGSQWSLEGFAQWGDWTPGRYALIAVVVGLIEIGRFGVDVDPDVPVPDHLPGVFPAVRNAG